MNSLLELLQNEIIQGFLIIIIIIVAFYLLKSATRILYKIMIGLIVLLACWFGFKLFFEDSTIEHIKNKYSQYCDTTEEIKQNYDISQLDSLKKNKENQLICECFIQVIENDLNNKFPNDKIKKIQRPFVDKQEFQKSFNLNTQAIKECLKKNKEEGLFEELEKQILQDMGMGLLDWFQLIKEKN